MATKGSYDHCAVQSFVAKIFHSMFHLKVRFHLKTFEVFVCRHHSQGFRSKVDKFLSKYCPFDFQAGKVFKSDLNQHKIVKMTVNP